ncbi:hypothetical protein BCR44DRAFT_65722 [Catenaria anguillulae PL171]|uniref:Uncharacterized protein n=1 Tax=Catenaria anguillulae PL171 TaxID=765915 RepID=A0A1Y2HGJ9_9FUNG|nr:hypothetical protein BCR44DRAFT_65722 [Catenaria anguillulae PL171]
MDTEFEPAITHIPDNFVLAKPHIVADDSSDEVETVLIRLPAGVTLAALDGVEFDWPPADGAVIPLAAKGSDEAAAPKASKKSKRSAAAKQPQDAPQLVFDSGLAPEAANMMVLVADNKKDSSSFRAHPITHVAAIAVPTSVPTAAIRDQGKRILDQPYIPRAQPDMPYREAFDAFASNAVPMDDQSDAMAVDSVPPVASTAVKRSAGEMEEEAAKPKKAKRSKTDKAEVKVEAGADGGAEDKEGGKKKKRKDKKKAKAE